MSAASVLIFFPQTCGQSGSEANIQMSAHPIFGRFRSLLTNYSAEHNKPGDY